MLETDAKDVLNEVSLGHLARVVGATERMSDRIDALLDLSRISRADLVRVPIAFGDIAAVVMDELLAKDPMRRADVTIAPGLQARSDARLIRAVLENLLGNAWKFTATRDRARIEVGAVNDADGRTFFVRDNGVGFDPAHADKLFSPFQRLHGAEFPRTGVGLATVQRIVERHRGRIWAESVVGTGATFYFTLPD